MPKDHHQHHLICHNQYSISFCRTISLSHTLAALQVLLTLIFPPMPILGHSYFGTMHDLYPTQVIYCVQHLSVLQLTRCSSQFSRENSFVAPYFFLGGHKNLYITLSPCQTNQTFHLTFVNQMFDEMLA